MFTSRQKLWACIPLAAIAVAVYYPFSPGGRQAANMRRADAIAALIRQQIVGQPRFADVSIDAGTWDGGCLAVFGSVPQQADSDELQAMINRTRPNIPVSYRVGVSK